MILARWAAVLFPVGSSGTFSNTSTGGSVVAGMPMRNKLAALWLVTAITGLTGCEVLPQRAEEPRKAEATPQQRQQAGRAAQQRKDAEREDAERNKAEREQCLASVEMLKGVLARWKEVDRQAATLPRLALAGPLGNMQKLRQELKETGDSSCAARANANLAGAMDLTISFYTNFARDDRNYLALQKANEEQGNSDRQAAKNLAERAAAELARIEVQ
jgi:hypothetical protein